MSIALPPGARRPDEPTGNPLRVLADAIERQTEALVATLQTVGHGQAEHVYALRQTDDAGTTWMTYCMACSDAQQRYVYPCTLVDSSVPRPPGSFTVLPTPPKEDKPADPPAGSPAS